MSWNPLVEPVNYFKLAGQKSPGNAIPVGADSSRKWDQANGYGLSGAFVRYTGDNLAEFDFVVDLLTPEEWDEWYTFGALLEKAPAGTRPKALDIWHPLLLVPPLNIRSVVVKNCTQFTEVKSEPGKWECKITFLQYRAPKAQYAKPDGAKATVADEDDREIFNKKNQLEALAR